MYAARAASFVPDRTWATSSSKPSEARACAPANNASNSAQPQISLVRIGQFPPSTKRPFFCVLYALTLSFVQLFQGSEIDGG